jgi:hypothetical protein
VSRNVDITSKRGDRDNIRNWRPITLLNSDYKIISKLLANCMKPVLNKIDDIIDNEDEEGVIIFVDQQKAFDRMINIKLYINQIYVNTIIQDYSGQYKK